MPLYPSAKINNDFLTNPLYGSVTGAQPQDQPPIPGVTDAPSLYNPAAMPAMPEMQTPEIKEDRPGFLRRIRSQPGGDMALLQFGAAMLSSQNFGEGLGKGALAYRQALDAEADKGKPKMTKDNEFTYTVDPETGQPVFTRTAVADFTEKQLATKLQTQQLIAKLRDDGQTTRTNITTDANKEHWDQVDKFNRDHMTEEGTWRDDAIEGRESVARIQAQSRLEVSDRNAANKLPPAKVAQLVNDHQKVASTTEASLAMGEPVVQALRGGNLKLGMAQNLLHAGMIRTGIGVTDSARQYGKLQQYLQTLVNTTLMDAKGVQTDGDAVRGRIMAMVSSGDSQGAAEEIEKAMQMQRVGGERSRAQAADLSRQYKLDTSSTDAIPANKPTARRKPSVSNW